MFGLHVKALLLFISIQEVIVNFEPLPLDVLHFSSCKFSLVLEEQHQLLLQAPLSGATADFAAAAVL